MPVTQTDYITKTYNALKDNLSGFDKTPQQFQQLMSSDADYRSRVYSALKDNVEGFNRTPTDFTNLVVSAGQKKSQNGSGLSVGSNGSLQTSSPTPLQSQSSVNNLPNVFDVSSGLPQTLNNNAISNPDFNKPVDLGENRLLSGTQLQQEQQNRSVSTSAPIKNTVDANNVGFSKSSANRLKEQNQTTINKAIDNATDKSLKLKGISAQPGSLLYNIERRTFQSQVDNGNAVVGGDVTGKPGLFKTTDWLESAKNGWNQATQGTKDADDFDKMTDQQKVDFLKQQPINKTPYIGTQPTTAGSITGGIARNAPFMGKALAGYGAGVATETLAPELSGFAIPKIASFLATADDMAKQTAMKNTASRYQIIKSQNPNMSDVDAMHEASKDVELDKAQGYITNYLFNETLDGNKPIVGEARNTLGNFVKSAAKAGAEGGGKVALTEIARDERGANREGGKSQDKIFSDAANDFVNQAGTIGALHALVGGTFGVLPEIVKSGLKNVLAKENPDHINSVLEANVQAGNITPEDATKTSNDIAQFSNNLTKIPEGASDEVKASVAGLMQKRDAIDTDSKTKDQSPSIQQPYKDQIESINNQIGEILRTGKPLEHEIDESTGQTYEKPTFDQVAQDKVEDLAKRISSGKKITEAEDLQTQQNFPQELESKLKSIANEEKAGNKGKENATTELSDNVNKYLEKSKAKAEPEIPNTTAETGITNEGTDKNSQPSEKNAENSVISQNEQKDNTTDGRSEGEVNQGGSDNSKTSKKEKGIFDRAKAIDANEPYDQVLQYFSSGGKIHNSVVDDLFGNNKKSTENQRKAMISFIRKDGQTIAQLAHSLWENDQSGLYDTEDYRNAIEQALQEHTSPASMAKELVARNDPDEAMKKFLNDRFGEGYGKENVLDAVDHVENMSAEEINHLLSLDADESKQKELEDFINSKEIQSPINTNQNEEGNQISSSSEGRQRPASEGGQEVNNNTGAENETAPVIESPKITIQNEQLEPTETGSEPPAESNETKTEGEEGDLTSIKNAFTQAKRDELGLNEEIPAAKKEFGTTWQEAKDKIDNGYNVQDLVDELKAKPRPLTDVENAMLLHHQNTKEIQLINTNKAINDAAEKGDEAGVAEGKVRKARLLDELQDIYDVDKAVGTENARGLASRKMIVDRKYSLANMVAEKRAAANDGKPLTEDQTKEVEELHAKFKKAQEEHDAYVKQAESEIKDLQEKILGKEVKDKKSAAQKLRDIADKIDKAAKGQAYSSVIPITPKMISGAIRLIADGLEKGGKLLDLIKDAIDEIKKSNPGVDEDKLNKEINKELINSGINSNKVERNKAKDYSGLIDRQELKLRANMERAKHAIDANLKKDDAAKRTRWQKVQDTFVKWQRAFKLSNPATLGKLIMAATSRAVTTPLEDVVGGVFSKAIPSLGKGAIGEGGGLNVRQTAKAYASALTEGIRDAAQILKKGGSGKSDLDVVFGKNGQLPPEAIDFFGQLHSATKAPIKRAIFERQLAKRIERSQKNGLDISDPMVQTKILTDSYKDANRAIFMQDNKISDGWNKMIHYFESKDPKTGKPNSKLTASTLQWLIPFIKVPTNIASEIGTNVYGVPVAAAKLVYHAFTDGIKNIDPDEKDVIMRELKKGSLGTAALALGYMMPQTFGGFYQDKEKRRFGDIKAGNMRIGGVEIPAWAIESPIFQAMQIGATVRRVKDTFVKGKEKGIGEGVWAGALGLADHVPLIDQPMRIGKAISDPKERQWYLGELAKGTLVPSIIQKSAEWTDDAKKRNPSNIEQHIETGIPGLREEVPEGKSINNAGGSTGGGGASGQFKPPTFHPPKIHR